MKADETAKELATLASCIPSTGGTERTVWVEFKGVRFCVRYMSRQKMLHFGEQCAVVAYDPKAKTRTRSLDVAKLTTMVTGHLLVGWSNCTLRTLQALMPLDTSNVDPSQLDAELPFNPENVSLVIANANGLDDFLQEIAMDPDNFRAVSSEELAKNSSPTPSGT